MSDYKRMKVSTLTGEHLGYLSMSREWTTTQAMVTHLDEAYQYKWVTVAGGLRLDQGTDGGDRSLTWGGQGFGSIFLTDEIYPCWGLGSNWVVVTHHPDETISFIDREGHRRSLGGGLGPLQWLQPTDPARLRFAFDES